MRAAYYAVFCVTLTLMSSCTSLDKNAAAALAKAGQEANQAVSDQSTSAQNTLKVLPQWWVTGQALACARTPNANSRAECLNNAEATAKSRSSKNNLDQISNVMQKRSQAALELKRAYGGFGDLVNYDASADAQTALNAAFSSINSFLSAVQTLTATPGLQPLGATAENIAAKGVGFLASQRQSKQILAASTELHKAVDAFFKGLEAERNKAVTENLLTQLAEERGTIYRHLIESGIISPKDALTPLVASLGQGMPVAQSIPKQNEEVIVKAAALSFQEQAKLQTSAVIASYESALSALKELSHQHENLERGAPLKLSDIIANAQKVADAIQSMNQGGGHDK